MRKPIDAAAFLIMVTLCMIWGLQQVALKSVAEMVDPVLQIAIRSAISAVMILLFSRIWRHDIWQPHILLGPGLITGSLFGLEFLFVAMGLRMTSAAHMAVFLYTAPIFAAVGLHVMRPDERLSLPQWGGVGVSFVGVITIFMLPGTEGSSTAMTKDMLFGDALGLCAGFFWGMTTVLLRTTRLSDIPPAQALFCQLLVAAMLTFLVCVVTGKLAIQNTALVWASLSFQTIVVCCISLLAWFRLLQLYLSSRLGILSFMTPIFGVACGVVLLGERMTPGFVIGATMVLVGMLIVQGQEWYSAHYSRKITRADFRL